MACPHVSGAAALLLEDRNMQPSHVLDELLARSAQGVLSGLTFFDSNNLVYIGESNAEHIASAPHSVDTSD